MFPKDLKQQFSSLHVKGHVSTARSEERNRLLIRRFRHLTGVLFPLQSNKYSVMLLTDDAVDEIGVTVLGSRKPTNTKWQVWTEWSFLIWIVTRVQIRKKWDQADWELCCTRAHNELVTGICLTFDTQASFFSNNGLHVPQDQRADVFLLWKAKIWKMNFS